MASARSFRLSVAATFLVAGVVAGIVPVFGGCGLSTHGTAEGVSQRCTAAAQCDDGNVCSSDSCTADGVCTHTAIADGDASAATQQPGSCQRSVCKAGALAVVPDDANVSDDGEPCTENLCKDGAPIHPARPDSTECKLNQATGRCTAGKCDVRCGQGLPPCDDGSACTDDNCDVASGKCVFAPLDGVKIPGKADPKGDCRTPLCVGGTEVSAAIDDADLPLVSTDCLTPTCTNGSPSTPVVATGTACATAGGRVCDGQGACVACNVEADCTELPVSDECTTRVCEAHACKLVFVVKDTKTKSQTVGDCQLEVCDGAGKPVSKSDDTDLPVDGNDCVDHKCIAGVPSTPPLAANVTCGKNQTFKCNGSGSCVGCLAPTDCAGVDDACKTRTCVADSCGFDYQTAGTVLPAAEQALGDCRRLECDGAGNVNSVPLDADLPVDGNDCTADVCTAGAASNPPLALDTACKTGFCDGAAACVECNAAAQCPAPPLCIAATCDAHVCGTTPIAAGTLAPPAQQTSADCKQVNCDGNGGTSQAPDPNDLPNDGKQCTTDACTAQGVPTFTPKPARTACSQNNGKVCDGATSCIGCIDNTDCKAPNICKGNVCVCPVITCASVSFTCGSLPDGCGGTLNCNNAKQDGKETDVDCGGALVSCVFRCGLGKKCVSATDCTSVFCGPDKKCHPASCNNGLKNGTETDVDCGGGTCQKCANGKDCGKKSDCVSDKCSNNKCN